MLKSIANYCGSISPVFLEGTLYVLIAVFSYFQTQLGSDEAAKYISPVMLFWSKFVVGSFLACWIAIKLFRSTSFADHQAKQKGDSQFWQKQPLTNQPPPATSDKA